jgi:plasmid stabilization system protein ParE
MSHYALGTEAALDLEQIWDYIAADSIDAADRWIGKFFDAFEELGKTPGLGHKREDLTSLPVFFWPVGSYLIIYRKSRGGVDIVAVTHGSRDIPEFLRHRIP